jgi:hypothetical protein
MITVDPYKFVSYGLLYAETNANRQANTSKRSILNLNIKHVIRNVCGLMIRRTEKSLESIKISKTVRIHRLHNIIIYELSHKDKEKRQKRRERDKQTAARCRKRRMDLMENLQDVSVH